MHKGWYIIFGLFLVQMALGSLIFFSAHGEKSGRPTPAPETTLDKGGSALSVTGELAFLPAALLPEAQRPDEDETLCVRICAVPAATAPLLSGRCSNPLSIVASIDDEGGESWLAVAISAGSGENYHPFLAATDRRLLVLNQAQCDFEQAIAPPVNGAAY